MEKKVYKYYFFIEAEDEEKADEILSNWDREMIMDNLDVEEVDKL